MLVTGEKGGSQAKLLLQATGIALVYDFFVTTFQVWKEYVDLQFMPLVQDLGEKARMATSFDAQVFILGLGYVMGLRSSMILVAGGVLSNFVLVPLIWMIGSHLTDLAVYPGTTPIAQMTADADLPRLRPVHRRRRHRHRRHLRHHQVAAGRRRVVLDRVQGVPRGRGHGRRSSAPTATCPIIAILLGVVARRPSSSRRSSGSLSGALDGDLASASC